MTCVSNPVSHLSSQDAHIQLPLHIPSRLLHWLMDFKLPETEFTKVLLFLLSLFYWMVLSSIHLFKPETPTSALSPLSSLPIKIKTLSKQLWKYFLNHPLSLFFLRYYSWTRGNISHRFLQRLLHGLSDSMLVPLQSVFPAAGNYFFLNMQI